VTAVVWSNCRICYHTLFDIAKSAP